MKKIMRAVALVTIISGITRLIAFVFKIFLSRVLGAEILGVYQITMSIFILFLSISASGIPTALSRHTAALRAKGDTMAERGMLTSALIVSSLISIIIMAFFYVFPNITRLLFSDNRCLRMFYIMLPALFSASIYSVIRGYIWGSKEYMIYSMSELVEEVLSVVIIFGTLALGLFGDNLSESIAVAFLISDYVGTILLVAIFALKGGRLAKPRLMQTLRRSALPLTSTRLLGSFVSSMMALLIPLMLKNNGMDMGLATASYGRASGMVMPLIFVPSTIISSLAIVIVPELASSKAKANKKTISASLTFALMVSCVFLVIYESVGDKICKMLYNDSLAGEYMSVAALLMVPMALNQMSVSVLNTLGCENMTFRTHIIGSSILAVLIFVLPKYIGIYAYFVGLIAFHTITGIIYLALIKRKIGYDNGMVKVSILATIYTLILAIISRAVGSHMSGTLMPIILISIIIFILYLMFGIKAKLVNISLITHKK